MIFAVPGTVTGSGGSISSRAAANSLCASRAASQGLGGRDWKIVVSMSGENAKDYLDYRPGDALYNLGKGRLSVSNLWQATYTLGWRESQYLLLSTDTNGIYKGCGSYHSSTWPLCQGCGKGWACSAPGASLFSQEICCTGGTREILCMGAYP